MWSDCPVAPSVSALGIREIDLAAGHFPKEGALLISGVHVNLGPWLAQSKLSRVIVRYNLPKHGRLFTLMEEVRGALGIDPEIRFASPALQSAVGLPGEVEPSLILLEPYLTRPLPAEPQAQFTVGRVSRDVLEKHAAGDAALYKLLAARGMRVRVMGGTCLAPQIGNTPGVELLAAGAEHVADFYRTIDVMFYRTGTFTEPYGRVIFEAMASGLPVVAGAYGGYANFLRHGEDSFLVNSQDEAWEALEMLAASVELRRAIGLHARERALQLHGKDAIVETARVYLQ